MSEIFEPKKDHKMCIICVKYYGKALGVHEEPEFWKFKCKILILAITFVSVIQSSLMTSENGNVLQSILAKKQTIVLI